jgi:hypothetical protein
MITSPVSRRRADQPTQQRQEAVPALHRARQVIVVGDLMQLPPTSYFQTRETADTDDEADDQRLGVVLDADSFLSVSSVRLPSTMLTWHYRSRYEALIQFSNAAFYEGRLATIPDRAPSEPRSDSLEIEGEPAGDTTVAALADNVRSTATGEKPASVERLAVVWPPCSRIAKRLQRGRSLCGADGGVVGDGEAHKLDHLRRRGIDEFQVPDGELPVLGCVGSFDVAIGAVEQG